MQGVKELVSETEEPVKLLTWWKFCLGQFTTLWNMQQTAIRFVLCRLGEEHKIWVNMCHNLQARLGRHQKSLSLCPHYFLFFLAKGKTVLKGGRFNNITIIQARSLDIFAKTQTMHFKKCFEQWYDHWACCRRSRDTLIGRGRHRSEGKCCQWATYSIQKPCDHTTLRSCLFPPVPIMWKWQNK